MGTRNEILGAAAIEYAAGLVVTERAESTVLRARLEALVEEVVTLRADIDRWRDYGNEKERNARHARDLMDRITGELEKIRDARFWKRRGLLLDLIERAYWHR